ncbi:MAG: Crp/Fnr family transcriptional regulator [Clostridiales bacterium]|nr:Crp/Fnr family transcriptional regulator [Clostridiales bacterium]
MGDAAYSHEAMAQEPTVLCVISQDRMRELILKNPLIGFKIMQAMNQKLTNLRSLVQSLATHEGLPRLAHLLLQLYEKSGSQKRFDLNLSREDIANFTGLTRETVSRKLAQLQDEGIIRLGKSREIEILDLAALQNYSA